MCQLRFHSLRSLRASLIASVFSMAALVGGCEPKILQHGNVPDEDEVVQIQPGLDDRNRVEQLLGSPSTTSTFNDEVWYYISKKTTQTAFFEPDVLDQGVLAISFDDGGLVQDLKIYDQQDGRLVAMVDRQTPTHGNELTLLQQLLGNFGRFNPEGSVTKTNPGSPRPTGG